MAKKKLEMGKTDKGMVPAELRDMYSEDSAENLANVKDAYFRVSIKGAKFKVDDNKIGVDNKGEEFSAVILQEVPVNSYTEVAYDPKAPAQQPTCWSLGGFKPVPGCDTPQAENCAVCDFNKFGSAVDVKTGEAGKGKRCANNRRLVMKVQGYDMPVLMSIPPTSRKNFDAYLKQLSAGEQKLPMFAGVTTFTFDESADWPVIEFKLGKLLSPDEYLACREFRVSDPVMDAFNAYATLIDIEDDEKKEDEF